MTEPLLPIVTTELVEFRSLFSLCSDSARKQAIAKDIEQLARRQDPWFSSFIDSSARETSISLGENAGRSVLETAYDVYWFLQEQAKMDEVALPKLSHHRYAAAMLELYYARFREQGNYLRERNNTLFRENPALAEYIVDRAARAETRPVSLDIAQTSSIAYWLLRSQAEANKLKELYERV